MSKRDRDRCVDDTERWIDLFCGVFPGSGRFMCGRQGMSEREYNPVVRRFVAALLCAFFLALPSSFAYAGNNETEMTGGFKPVEISRMSNDDSKARGDGEQSPATTSTSNPTTPSDKGETGEPYNLEDVEGTSTATSVVPDKVSSNHGDSDVGSPSDGGSRTTVDDASGTSATENETELGAGPEEAEVAQKQGDAPLATLSGGIAVAIAAVGAVALVLWLRANRRRKE